jgi:hypothetical protein
MSEFRPISHTEDQVTNDTILNSATNTIWHELPVEIWHHIFEECTAYTPRALTPLSWSFNLPKQRQFFYTNIVISHVCRYFRKITLSTPVLWSALNLDGPKSEVETFLRRSGQLPITITSLRDIFEASYPRHSDTFAAISKRIVCIDTPVEIENYDLTASCKNLKHIMLRGKQYGTPRVHHIGKVLNEFGHLEAIWWTNRSFDPSSSPSLQRKYSLRSLHLAFQVSDTFLLPLLHCCPLLENLSARVTHVIDSRTDKLGDQIIRLPHLRDLRLQISGEDSWLCQLDVPPILDHLEFSYCAPHPVSSSQMWSMGTKSLVLGDYPDLSSMVSWLASESGLLKTLTLRMKQTDQKRILQALKVKEQRALCPKLEQVHIRFLLPPKRQRRPPGYRKRDYEDLLYDIFSSRVQVGLPPLQFTLDGEMMVPREKAARGLDMEISDSE